MNKVVIDRERCKGCGLCVKVCPKHILGFESDFNAKGYNPAVCSDESACLGCTMCAQTCPDIAIEVFTERS
jgi:2-oxoglutarate ferredoxin oxidoreductase subunit delta